jgi:hypothetical protein
MVAVFDLYQEYEEDLVKPARLVVAWKQGKPAGCIDAYLQMSRSTRRFRQRW